MSGDQVKHGDSPGISGYRRGCKCEVCRTAKRDYMRVWRSRRREAEATASGAEPMVERVAAGGEDRPELASAPALDLAAEPGAIERAFELDLAEPAGEVLWKNSYLAMARFNARMMDQVVRHERLDLMPSVMLRQNEIFNKLTYLKLGGHLDDHTKSPADASPETAADSSDEVAKEAARMLHELEHGGPAV